MATFRDCAFTGTTVILDGNEYEKCNFMKCKIIVTRGNFSLRHSTFDSCNFEFGGEAANIRDLVMGLISPNNKKQPKGA